jgi:hypothetical protein
LVSSCTITGISKFHFIYVLSIFASVLDVLSMPETAGKKPYLLAANEAPSALAVASNK